MLNRKECKKMLVWNDDESDAVERIVIEVLVDGSCYAVRECDEDNFLNDLLYGQKYWMNCKPIPEKKKRPLTHAEIFKAISEGAVIRGKDYSGEYRVSNFWDTDNNPEELEICYNYTGTDSDVWEPMEKEVE